MTDTDHVAVKARHRRPSRYRRLANWWTKRVRNTTKATLVLLAIAAVAATFAVDQYKYVRVMEQQATVVDATVVRYDDCSPFCGRGAANHYVVNLPTAVDQREDIEVYDWAWSPKKPGEVVQVLFAAQDYYIQDADLSVGEDGSFYARWTGVVLVLAAGVYLSPRSRTARRFAAAVDRYLS